MLNHMYNIIYAYVLHMYIQYNTYVYTYAYALHMYIHIYVCANRDIYMYMYVSYMMAVSGLGGIHKAIRYNTTISMYTYSPGNPS